MVFEAKFDSFNEIAEVQKLAQAVEEPVFFESEDGSVRIDASPSRSRSSPILCT